MFEHEGGVWHIRFIYNGSPSILKLCSSDVFLYCDHDTNFMNRWRKWTFALYAETKLFKFTLSGLYEYETE